MSVKRTIAPGSGDAGAAVRLACASSAPGNIEKTAIAVLNIVFTSLCFGWVEVKLTYHTARLERSSLRQLPGDLPPYRIT